MLPVLDLARMASSRRRKLDTVALVLLLLAINLPSTIRRLTASNRLRKEAMSTVLVLLLLAINLPPTIRR